jgi:predicted small metal-binding protein
MVKREHLLLHYVRGNVFILEIIHRITEELSPRRCEKRMAKTYHCNKCGRDIIAPTKNEVLKKVQLHGKQKHEMKEYSSTQLREIRRRIESYMEN